ncbi:MAG TPA: bifunctional diaminohydroxyphosphoribosylaminopyrimidine deaminase/5-amino-6-(5-phosphoribosylamino)uracil reductase RibD [Planctomycetes bacterium]|nr:bifunctional diaminohydroxyphosphoribosylaminopyrimidine deaminase/5-amino-6-(5-phosphoribosylamino)uracil reductase RibD [Planctomycetota bacterium]
MKGGEGAEVFAAWLEEAAGLARGSLYEGKGWVAPNPMVGALAIERGEVVGRGLHRVYGGPHAEEEALRAAARAGAHPDTLVVTLEPCSSTGPGKKRPPCTETILGSHVQRVVVGLEDPDPRHQGRGLDLLRERGIAVHGPFSSPALQELLGPFRKACALDRPWVIAKWAMSMDGKTATRTGSSAWISGERALDFGHRLRASCDGVLVGYRTALLDRPRLTVRRVQGSSPQRVVLDPRLELPLDSPLFRTEEAPTWVFHLEGQGGEKRAELEDRGVRCLSLPALVPGGRVPDLTQGLRLLRAEGLRRLLVEGGGRTLAQLLKQDCVDQCLALVSPKLVGGEDAPTPLGGEGVVEIDQALVLAQSYSYALERDLLMGGFLL